MHPYPLDQPEDLAPCLPCARRTGAIGPDEFRDRFFAIFGAAGSEVAEELFKEMAMMVPALPKRAALLARCRDVSGASCVD